MKATAAHQTPCLVADESDLPKSGRCFEMIGKVFGHKDRKYLWDSKSLNLSYWTGKTRGLIAFQNVKLLVDR